MQPRAIGLIDCASVEVWYLLQLSEKVLQDQVLAQLFAGHETTAAIMTRMLQRIKANPQVLACMKQEQASLKAQHGPELTGRGQDCCCMRRCSPAMHC